MKTRCWLVLLALSLSLLSPLSINISPSDKDTFIVTLDVCHAAGSAVSLNSDMPVIYDHPVGMRSLEFAGFVATSDYRTDRDILSFQLERPPRP